MISKPVFAGLLTLLQLTLLTASEDGTGVVREADDADATGASSEIAMLAQAIRVAEDSGQQPEFGEHFFVAVFLGDEFHVTSMAREPTIPDTLNKYLNKWTATARARLLMTFGDWRIGSSMGDRYDGLPEEFRTEFRTAELANEARIRKLVDDGGYRDDWEPFVSTYRRFLSEAKRKALEARKEAPELNLWELSTAIQLDNLAEQRGIRRLIVETRIEPEDLAEEMYRIVADTRADLGVTDGEVPVDHLFYSCGTSSSLQVRANPAHELADKFYAAYVAGSDDPEAKNIVDGYNELVNEIKAWSRDNPLAGTPDVDSHIRLIIADLGLIDQIRAYSIKSAKTGTDPPKKEG